VDLICFPETAFTGYAFPDARAIAPHLEPPLTGPTSAFCAHLAARVRCFVVAGYPELLPPTDTPIGANSAALRPRRHMRRALLQDESIRDGQALG
jgi:predicted amidohydrolase